MPSKLERVIGVAPISQPWRGRILLLNYTRGKKWIAGLLEYWSNGKRKNGTRVR